MSAMTLPPQADETFFKRFNWWIKDFAFKYMAGKSKPYLTDEAISEGWYAMADVLQSYDPSFGAALFTWVVRKVKHKIQDWYRDNEQGNVGGVRIPRTALGGLMTYDQDWAEGRPTWLATYRPPVSRGRGPNKGRPKGRACPTRLRPFMKDSQAAELPPERDGPRVTDRTAADTRNTFEELERREAVVKLMACLKKTDREILLLYFFEDLTMREIGECVGLSESRICRRYQHALAELRSHASRIIPLYD